MFFLLFDTGYLQPRPKGFSLQRREKPWDELGLFIPHLIPLIFFITSGSISYCSKALASLWTEKNAIQNANQSRAPFGILTVMI